MNITALILAGIAGSVLGYVVFRFSRNRGIALIIPLLIVAGVVVLLPPSEKQDAEVITASDSSSGSSDENAGQSNQDLVAAGGNHALKGGGSGTAVDEAVNNLLTLASFEQSRPVEIPKNGYTGSDSCLECHQDNHSSWDNSYHSTMTQLATPMW
jgi:hypothetical protein